MSLETAIIEFSQATQNLKAAMDQEYSQYREENAYRHLQLKFMAIVSIQHFKPLPKALLDLVWRALWMRPNSQVIYKELTLLPGEKMTSLHDDYMVRSAKLQELAKAVKEMRKLQKNYFSSRSKTVLVRAIKHESHVDELLKGIDC